MNQNTDHQISLVFLHGFPFHAKSWNPQIAYVDSTFANKVKCFAPNLRGHRPRLLTEAAPWMLEHFVADLERYLDDCEIDKAVICGLSMGGYIALRFATKHPNRVAGLILADTKAEADSNDAKEKRFALIERLHREGVRGFAAEFSKQVLSDESLAERPELQNEIEAMILGHDAKDLALVVGALASRPDSTVDIAQIDCPTAVIVGRDDKITPVKLSEWMAVEIPSAELHIIERAGHVSNMEQPEAFNRILGDYLERALSHKLLGGVFEKHRIKIVEEERRHSPDQNKRD